MLLYALYALKTSYAVMLKELCIVASKHFLTYCMTITLKIIQFNNAWYISGRFKNLLPIIFKVVTEKYTVREIIQWITSRLVGD